MSRRFIEQFTIPGVPSESRTYLLPACGRRIMPRLIQNNALSRGHRLPRLLLIDGSDLELERLRLSIAVRLYGYSGGLILLDALLRRHVHCEALSRLAALSRHCSLEHAILVIASQRGEAAMRRLVAPALGSLQQRPMRQPALGRKRSTTSIPTISMPSGGSGYRLTPISSGDTSISLPSLST